MLSRSDIIMNMAMQMHSSKDGENVTNEHAMIDYSQPGPSREHVDLDNLSSDLSSGKERCVEELKDFFEDSDCSIKDKDYVPESESSDDDIADIEQSPNILVKPAKNSSRWKKSDPSQWKKNINKRKKIESKTPKPTDCSKCRFRCSDKISLQSRLLICKNFWVCNFKSRKDFILNNVETSIPQRRNAKPDSKKKPRLHSKSYFFESSEIKIRVCKKFFGKTLCISNDVIEHAFKYKGEGRLFSGEDKRGKQVPHNKTNPADTEKVMNHILSFPVTESHYTRKSSKRQYLDTKLSIAKMHSLYKEVCDKDGSKPVKLITYRRIFCKNFNYSFYMPKKDQCQICAQYQANKDEETKQQLETNYQTHILRKNDCYTAKTKDKERAAKEKNFRCCTFDLQAVLQIPSSDVSPMYYSRKLCVYNLTIYEMSTPNNAFCYAWTELNGKRGSLEIGTCLYKYIAQLPDNITDLALFSDTCSGQNRNKNISALLLYVVQNYPKIKTIEHKFLESGHSYMEVDSMHSAIEKAKKNVPVYSLHDWLTIFRVARTTRSHKSPYTAIELKFSDFLDLNELAKGLMKNRLKNAQGGKVNWLQVKCFRYQKCKPWVLEYRYDHTSEYLKIIVFGKGRPPTNIISNFEVKKAYAKLLPITAQKKKDLLILCKTEEAPIREMFNLRNTKD